MGLSSLLNSQLKHAKVEALRSPGAIAPGLPSKEASMVIVFADGALQEDILSELKFDPQIRAPEIGVRVKDGIVTLTGTVEGYAQRWAAERAAKRVAGVKGIANEI